jgi:hypothetical protein
MKTLLTTVALISLASALMPVTALTARAAEQAMPEYHQIPQNSDEFVAEYNKVLAFLRSTEVQPIHKCFKPGDDPTDPLPGWCNNFLRWGNQKGEHVSAGENQRDDGGMTLNSFCFGTENNLQRCYLSNGRVMDQSLNFKTRVYVTYRQIAAEWSERGKPLSDLKMLNQPQEAASPKPPELASPSLPEKPN